MDIRKDPFEKYYLESEPTKRESAYYWQTAIGLQAVDGLEVSEYLQNVARENIEGKLSVDEIQELLSNYYEEHPDESGNRIEEADKVSIRIRQILSEKAFTFSSTQYISIHKRLFDGIYPHAGIIRNYNITKREWVLDGDTVLYGGASELRDTLEYDFSQERDFSYARLSMPEVIRHLAVFISRLWQIHIFSEGNTRTTAVFFIKYLRSMGFDVTNDIFAKNAWYFRNSMVRANYTNVQKKIYETTEYLERFLRNLLLGERNLLLNRSMHISGVFQLPESPNEKQYIGNKKQYIQSKKQYIDRLLAAGCTKKTTEHMLEMFRKFGEEQVFGRTEVAALLGLSVTPTTTLLKKLRDSGVIEPVKGMGKGKYRFISHGYS